ncbi:hypothetical protein A8M77_15895 [Variovorax sp. JS1663]|nr:hypothetical protein A8M77_15895 [Variovorax sp. JS1663]
MNIAREAGRRIMAIGIFIKDRDMGSVVKDMQARVAQNVKLPTGYTVGWSGEFENQGRAMARLAVVVPISLLLIFVVLFDAFKSLKMASLILLNVPLALIGGFVALWLFGIPLSVSAAIGSETQRPLAIVVIGGLVTATLLTLVVLPALYVAWFAPRRQAAGNAESAPPTLTPSPQEITS